MSLSALQQQFAQDSAKLIQFAASKGYAVTYGEVWRTPQQAQWNADHGIGIACSLHLERLAVDLNVFVDGAWDQTNASGCYKELGDFWKSLGPDHYWGGAWGDMDHYSISPDGGHTK